MAFLACAQACFSAEWAALGEASFRNFLAEVVQQLPLPALLRFNADRERRAALQAQCTQLTRESAQLRKVGLRCSFSPLPCCELCTGCVGGMRDCCLLLASREGC